MKKRIMRTEKIYIAAWLLFTIFLLFGSTGTVAQTYKRTFILEFAPKSFPIKKGHPMMVGDDKEYNFIQSLSPEEVAFFKSRSGRDRLYANFEENTLHVYGRIGVGCYRYPMECRIIGNEILLEVNDMHYGD